jgi:tetratricopeptide (TPR) repeat protein
METVSPDQTNSKIPASTSSFSLAAQPNNALTQKKPIAAQSDWHRVRAGGLILEDAAPDSVEDSIDGVSLQDNLASSRATETDRHRSGLPDRSSSTANTLSPNSRMVSSKSQELPSNTDGAGQAIRLRTNNSVTPLPSDNTMLEQPTVEESQRWNDQSDRPTELAYEQPMGMNTKPLVVEAPPERLEMPERNRALDLGTKTEPDRKKNEEYEIQRVALAQKVSHELLSQSPYPASRAPEILEAPPGWQSVRQELTARLERCDSLLKRGAVHSAREEALQGMRRLFRTMDIHRRSLVSEPAFDKAIVALKEESDFQNIVGNNQHLALPSIVASHSTEALKGRPLDNVSPEIAAQHYRMYARYQLVLASDGHPWASDLLYAYGKTLEKEAEQEPFRGLMLRNQSVACYQAATQVAPNQSEASNQLGFALIHLDRIEEAYQALTASIQNRPTANAWNNLAEIYRRQGATDKAEYAVQQATSLSGQATAYSAENPEVTEVDPAVFARYSPMPAVGSQAPGANPPATNQVSGNPVRSATTSNSIMSKIFR